MTNRPYISLILPAFNEAATIGKTVEEAIRYFSRRGWTYQIIVAADGEDATRDIVSKMAAVNPNLHVIGSRERLGKGRGIRMAVALATGEIIGYADADNKVPIEEFDKFEPCFAQEFDIAIGSRGLAQSTILRAQPWYRRVGSRTFAVVLHAIVGLREFVDTQCGFKFFRRGVAQKIFAAQQIDGYMFDIEVLAMAQRLGCRVAQIPVVWRDDGDSRLQLVRGNLQNGRDLFRIRASLRSLDRSEQTIAAKGAAQG